MTTLEHLAAIDLDELEATYLAHQKLCPGPECCEMDRRLGCMCIHPGCRNAHTPDSWGCSDHPHATLKP